MLFEIVKLFIIFPLPFWLIYTGKHKTALMWLAVTAPLDAFAVSIVVRMTCISVLGMMALPFVCHKLATNIRKLTKAEALVLACSALMFLGMVYFGFLNPWVDATGQRPFNQAAPGRSLIFTFRYLCDFSAALYAAYVIRKLDHPQQLMRFLLIGTSLVAAGVIFQVVTGLDLYYHLNAAAPAELTDLGRARGFCYEPRCAGQWSVAGILLCIGLTNLGKRRWSLMLLFVLSLLATLSTSGFLLLTICVTAMATMLRRARAAFFVIAGIGVAFVVLSYTVPVIGQYWELYERMATNRLGRDSLPENAGIYAKMKDKLEVFDYAAAGFLEANPQYLIFGTGAGVISIPSSHYLRDSDKAIWGDRIDSIPHGGFLQILSNVGIVGLILWLMLCNYCRLAMLRLLRETKQVEWQDAYVLFVTFCVFYLVMIREVWLVALGMGLGAALLARNTKQVLPEDDNLASPPTSVQ